MRLLAALALACAPALAEAPPPPQPASALRAAVAPHAAAARERRTTLAGAYALTSAGMIGGGVTYVAVAYLDGTLGTVEGEDTIFAGAALGGAALVPAALAAAELFVEAPAERRLDEVDAGGSLDDVVAAQSADASGSTLLRVGAGLGFLAGGAVAATAGSLSLARPHTTEHRSFVTHGTGAELIGLGVASVGVGVFTLLSSDDDAALLDALRAVPPTQEASATPAPAITAPADEPPAGDTHEGATPAPASPAPPPSPPAAPGGAPRSR